MLLETDPDKNPDQPIPATYPEVTFAYIKHMWKCDQKLEAFQKLQHFVKSTLRQLTMQTFSQDDKEQDQIQKLLKLQAR